MSTKRGSIYCLIDPNTELVRYIGMTVNSLNTRLCEHVCTSKQDKSNQYKCNWIKSLLKSDQRPIIKLLSRHNLKDLPDRKSVV